MGHLWTTTPGSIKLLAMHGSPLSYNKNQKNFATNSPKRENANELDDEMSEIEHLKAKEMNRTYCL